MNKHCDAPIENTSEPFTAPTAKTFDRRRLVEAVEDLAKVYEQGKRNDNPLSLRLPFETVADIKVLRKAQTLLARWPNKEKNKELIDGLEREIISLETILSLTKKPKGPQIDIVFDAAICQLDKYITDTTGAHDWAMLADVITKHLKPVTRNQLLKAYKRVQDLLADKEKFKRVRILNAKYSITKDDVERTIKESRSRTIP